MIGIYGVKNLRNGKVYVGSSVDIMTRWRSHKSLLSRNEHPNRHLQAAVKRYGLACFDCCVLEQVDEESLLAQREAYWIELLEAADDRYGYNISCDPRTPSIPCSEDKKAVLSAKAKARWAAATAEEKERRQQHLDAVRKAGGMTGRRHTAAAKERMRRAHTLLWSKRKEALPKEQTTNAIADQ